jgi:hypothetical protein
MAYAKIKNGGVAKIVDQVPTNDENTSGLAWLSADALALRGWLPVNDVKPALGPLERYGEPTTEVGALEVIRTFPVVKPTLSEAQKIRKREFKEELSRRIYELRDIDEFVVLLVTNTTPNALKTKVEALVTAHNNAVTALTAAATVDDVLAVTVTWPA